MANRASKPCSVPNCERPRCRTASLCTGHLSRKRRTGDVGADVPLRERRVRTDVCAAEGCDKPTTAYSRSAFCGGHQRRKYRTGKPLKVIAPAGTGHLRADGYMSDFRPDHPLAKSQGSVLRHRLVLYAKIGPGDQPCHWCGCVLSWSTKWGPLALTGDHLDGDRLNNDSSNIVPACNSCNSARKAAGNPRYWQPTAT